MNATLWIEHWMPTGEWQLCIALNSKDTDLCTPLHETDAVYLKAKGLLTRVVWDPMSQGKLP